MEKRIKLDLAIRKNRGARIMHKWIKALEEACGNILLPLEFLSIEETEELKKSFFEKIKSGKEVMHCFWSRDLLDKKILAIEELGYKLGNMPIILFSDVDQYIGAVRLPANQLFPNIMAIWKLVGEDLSVTTQNIKDGLCLEFNFYNEQGDYVGEGVFELNTWGKFAVK